MPAALRSSSFKLLLLSLAAYWAVLIYQLGAQWSAYEQYNYGWAVPFLCAYLLWQRLTNHESRISPPATRFHLPSSIFYSLFALLALLWFIARWLHEANPIWRLTSWVLALVVVSLTLLVLSSFLTDYRSHRTPPVHQSSSSIFHLRLSDLVFPICFFLVAVPWPTGIELGVTQFLMQANVATTTELLAVVGIPALQKGNVIEIATGLVGVDEACSGIRSFQATLMIALFLGELYRLSGRRRAGLCLTGFALAFFFNVGRTFLLVYVASRRGIEAIAQWHDPAGITILVGCFVGLWVVALLLRRAEPSPPRTGRGQGEVSNPASPGSLHPPSPGSAFPVQLCSFQRLSLALLGWFIFTEVAVEVWYRAHETRAAAAQQWTVRWPVGQASFKRVELSERVQAWLAFDEGGQCAWIGPDGSWWQMFYFRWQPSRSLYARVRSQLNKTHRPEHCLTGSGMKQVGDLGPGRYDCGGVQLALNRLLFESDGKLLRVFYAQYEDSAKPELLASYRANTAQRLAAARAGSRNYGLRILELAVAGNLDEQQADAALQLQLEQVIQVPPVRNP